MQNNDLNLLFFQVFTTKSEQEDIYQTLAAVGAGLVPATMAMIVPLALGRKRRSINDFNELQQQFHQNTQAPIVQPM